MTAFELAQLSAGDSVIGLDGDWTDEFPVVEVGPLKNRRDGRARRMVSVKVGKRTASALIISGNQEIRSTASDWVVQAIVESGSAQLVSLR